MYRACGILCGLALYHGYLLGLPLSEGFLRLIVQDPPTTLQELQDVLNRDMEESGSFDWLGSGEILTKTLSEAGLDDTLTFSRTLSSVPKTGLDSSSDTATLVEVELMEGGKDVVVTNDTK
eukprot:SAG31_NODE_844_length_11549_cov_2.985852_14_plen_121_part_00